MTLLTALVSLLPAAAFAQATSQQIRPAAPAPAVQPIPQQQPAQQPAQQQAQQQQDTAAQPLDAKAQAQLDTDLADTANVAGQWLKLIDDGKYGDSWDYGSQTFKFTIKRDEWIKAEEKLRQPLGRLVSRKLVEQRTAKNPKGLPQGDYMVLYFKSSFSNRPEANELVTMVRESDGKWRVLTYHAS